MTAAEFAPVPEPVVTEIVTDANQLSTRLAADLGTSPDGAPEEAFSRVAEGLHGISDLRKQIAETFDEPIAQAHRLHRSLIAKKRTHDDPLAALETRCRRWLSDWKLAEERRLQEIAAKAEAEAKRAEEEARLQMAVALEEAGEAAAAEQVIETPLPLPPPPAPARAVAKGISTSERWDVKVVSVKELCRAIGEGKVPEHFVNVNLAPLRQLARAQRGAMSVPGVEAVRDLGIARR